MHRWSSVLLVSLFSVAALAAAEPLYPSGQMAGYGRDGSRIHPDASPPSTWSDADVAWETPLPSWGHGSPIVVGGKVFALCELTPANDFPLLVCLDAESGKLLWQREVDHLSATGLPPAKQEEVRKIWHDYIGDFYRRQELHAQYREADDRDAFKAKLGTMGYRYNRRWDRVDQIKKDKRIKELKRQAGFSIDGWLQGGMGGGVGVIGQAYATPVSDGEHVYVATAFNAVACYDLEGECQWIGFANGSDGKYCYCSAGRSPIIWKDLVISDSMNLVRAFDRSTGELLWSDPIEHHHTIVTPAVLSVDGRDILFAAGCQAYLLPEGKRLTVEGWRNEGMQILVKHDEPDVAFFCGSGEHCGWAKKGKEPPHPPAMVRFSLAGDTLTGEVVWHGGTIYQRNEGKLSRGPTYGVVGGNVPWMLYDRNRLYHIHGGIIDVDTADLVAGNLRAGMRAVPETTHLLLMAGDHVYGFKAGIKNRAKEIQRFGTCEVYTRDGTFVARNRVPRREPTPEQKRMLRACSTVEEFSGFSYGAAFTIGGDRLYFRSLTSVVCIGK